MASKYNCEKCGSADVISDTRAEWNLHMQEWTVVGHYDSSECLDCEEEDCIIEVALEPAGA